MAFLNAAYDPSTNTIMISDVSPALTAPFNVNLLNAVTADVNGTSAPVDVSLVREKNIFLTVSVAGAAGNGVNIVLEGSLDGVTFGWQLWSHTYTSTGVAIAAKDNVLSRFHWTYMRVVASGFVNATVTCDLIARGA